MLLAAWMIYRDPYWQPLADKCYAEKFSEMFKQKHSDDEPFDHVFSPWVSRREQQQSSEGPLSKR